MPIDTIKEPGTEGPVPTEEQLDAVKTAAFAEGFKDESTETPIVSDEPPTPVVTEPIETAPAIEPVLPKYAQITEDQLADLLKLNNKVGKLDEGFGTLGNIKQRIEQLDARQTADGKPVEVTDEDMADLKAEFPEFADLTKKVLAKVVAKMRGPGQAPVDMEALVSQAEARAEDRVLRTIRKEADADLQSDHPDWRKTVWGDQDDGKTEFKDVKTPFTAWLATQPDSTRQRILDSNNAEFLSRQLTRFKQETAEKPKPNAPAQKPSERTARLAASVSPRGVAPAGSPPEENSVASGFRQEMKAMGQPVH
jgi:hypothetical protein